MAFKKMVADAVAKASFSMAKKACGAASFYGLHQPKEPAKLAKSAK